MASPREQAELPYKGRSGEDEAVEEEASRSSSQRERKQGKSSKEQPDRKGKGCPPNSDIREGNEGEKSGHNIVFVVVVVCSFVFAFIFVSVSVSICVFSFLLCFVLVFSFVNGLDSSPITNFFFS